MSIFFTADTHFFDTGALEFYKRPFLSLEEMHDVIIDRWNTVISKSDIVYHLGDFARAQNSKDKEKLNDLLSSLNGQKFLVRGNHDNKVVRGLKSWITVWDLKEVKATPNKEIKVILCHYALRSWKGQHRDPPYIHCFAHSHGQQEIQINGSMDVGVDTNLYSPYSLDNILQQLC